MQTENTKAIWGHVWSRWKNRLIHVLCESQGGLKISKLNAQTPPLLPLISKHKFLTVRDHKPEGNLLFHKGQATTGSVYPQRGSRLSEQSGRLNPGAFPLESWEQTAMSWTLTQSASLSLNGSKALKPWLVSEFLSQLERPAIPR